MALSPMMQQYLQIKEENKDKIVFFRLGDFYEMFFDDAIFCSSYDSRGCYIMHSYRDRKGFESYRFARVG